MAREAEAVLSKSADRDFCRSAKRQGLSGMRGGEQGEGACHSPPPLTWSGALEQQMVSVCTFPGIGKLCLGVLLGNPDMYLSFMLHILHFHLNPFNCVHFLVFPLLLMLCPSHSWPTRHHW